MLVVIVVILVVVEPMVIVEPMVRISQPLGFTIPATELGFGTDSAHLGGGAATGWASGHTKNEDAYEI